MEDMNKAKKDKLRKNPLYTVESLKIRRGQKKRRDLTTAFGFLKAHNGLRKGKLHVLLSRTGGGKSTLARSILFDALDNNPDLIVFIYLSEEQERDFLDALAETNYDNQEGLDRIRVYSEKDSGGLTVEELHSRIEYEGAGLFILDNITTWDNYENEHVSTQGAMVKQISKAAGKLNIPFFILSHTRAEVTKGLNRLIDVTDVRGSKQLANYAEFFYILQSFDRDQTDSEVGHYSSQRKRLVHNCLQIEKCRTEKLEHPLWLLIFSDDKRIYDSDVDINFEAFKRFFTERNRL